MKSNLNTIFILITISMLGIVFYQIDWLHKSYQEKRNEFPGYLSGALPKALEMYRKEYGDSVNMLLKNKKPHSAYVGLIKRINASENNPCSVLFYKNDSVRIAGYLNKAMADLHNVSVSFKLSFYCKEKRAPNPWGRYYSDLSTSGTARHYYQPLGLYELEGKEDKYVQAKTWDEPRPVILKGMMNEFIFSLLLIITVISSFAYQYFIIMRQKRLAEMKDDFINNMTHELKTPIATISAAIEGMQSFNALEDKEKTERYLETSRQELKRLNDLVTKVLNMAGYEKKKIELVIKKLDVSELITEIKNAAKLNATKTINLTFNNADHVTHINADPVHFRNTLANLIDNAIKYSGDPVNITISCYSDEKSVYFSVKDDGIGIPASQITHIFDKFHRVPTGNVHNIKGTGLGLSYVKYVMEMHGGTVSVKSEPGKGSEFTISLLLK